MEIEPSNSFTCAVELVAQRAAAASRRARRLRCVSLSISPICAVSIDGQLCALVAARAAQRIEARWRGVSRIAASRAPRARRRATSTSSCTITPLSASSPSTRAGASPVSCATSRAMRTAAASATASTRSPRAPSCGSKVSVAWIDAALEALIRQRARGRLDAVEARRQAQAQIEPAAVDALRLPAPAQRLRGAPCASANPVMLTMVIATPSGRRNDSPAAPCAEERSFVGGSGFRGLLDLAPFGDVLVCSAMVAEKTWPPVPSATK